MPEYGPVIMQYRQANSDQKDVWSDMHWCYFSVDENSDVQTIKVANIGSIPAIEECTTLLPTSISPMWIYDPNTQASNIYAVRVNEENKLIRYDFRVTNVASETTVIPMSKKFSNIQNGWGPDNTRNRPRPREVIDDSYYNSFATNIEEHAEEIEQQFKEYTDKQNAASEIASAWLQEKDNIDFTSLEEAYNTKSGILTPSQQASFAQGQGFYYALSVLKTEANSQQEYLQSLSDILTGNVGASDNNNAAVVRHYLIPSYIDEVKWFTEVTEGEEPPSIGDAYDWLTSILLAEGCKYQADFAAQTNVLNLSAKIRDTKIGTFSVRDAIQGLNADAIEIFNFFANKINVTTGPEINNLKTTLGGILNSEPGYWQARSDLELLYYSAGLDNFADDFNSIYRTLALRQTFLEIHELFQNGDQAQIYSYLESLSADTPIGMIVKFSDAGIKFKLIQALADFPKFQVLMQAEAGANAENNFDLDAFLIWNAYIDEQTVPKDQLDSMIEKIGRVLDDNIEAEKTIQQLKLYYTKSQQVVRLESFYSTLTSIKYELIKEQKIAKVNAIIEANDQQALFEYIENLDDLNDFAILLNFQQTYFGLSIKDLFTQEKLLKIIGDSDNLCALLEELSPESINQIISVIETEGLLRLINGNMLDMINLLKNKKTYSSSVVINACAKLMESPDNFVRILNNQELHRDYKINILKSFSKESLEKLISHKDFQEYLANLNFPEFVQIIIFSRDKNILAFSTITNQMSTAMIAQMFTRNFTNLPVIIGLLTPEKTQELIESKSIDFAKLDTNTLNICLNKFNNEQLLTLLSDPSAIKKIISILSSDHILQICIDKKTPQGMQDSIFNELLKSEKFADRYLSISSLSSASIDAVRTDIDNLIQLNYQLSSSQQKSLLQVLVQKPKFFEGLAHNRMLNKFLNSLKAELKAEFINNIVAKNYPCVQTYSDPSFTGLAYVFNSCDNVKASFAAIDKNTLDNALLTADSKQGFELNRQRMKEAIIDALSPQQLNLFSQHYFKFPATKFKNVLRTLIITKNVNTLPGLLNALPRTINTKGINSVEELQKSLLKKLSLTINSEAEIQELGVSLWMVATFSANSKLAQLGAMGNSVRDQLVAKEKQSWSVWSIHRDTQEEFTNIINHVNKIADEAVTQEQLAELGISVTESPNRSSPGKS